MTNNFSHVNNDNQPSIVNIFNKNITKRFAKARSLMKLPMKVWKKLNNNKIINTKGAVLHTAIIAGIIAVKNTHNLIPLCHPLYIEDCQIKPKFSNNMILSFDCSVKNYGKTGVEMEALVGASIAALTTYDMCKSVSHEIVIERIYLLSKTGGKNDFKQK
jgi:cyclic pyranopterin phosphate synthase